ncbi:hypothetical protein CR513_47641, partial [Mucuna pruriens]
MEKQHLIELWMANGFISSNERLDAKDVGDELGQLKLKRDLHIKHMGRVKSAMDAKEANMSRSQLQENVEDILEVLQSDVQHLQILRLVDCESYVQLPVLGKLPSLKDLSICNMINVKYVYKEYYDGGVVFMALESLIFRKLSNLIRLLREDGGKHVLALFHT